MTLQRKTKNDILCFMMLILFFLTLGPELMAGDKYISIGPSFGYYRTTDTAAKFNDVIKVRGRLRYSNFGFEFSIGHKNEIYKNDLVWVKSWPMQLSCSFYPLFFAYISGGAGLFDLYIDYNQHLTEMQSYGNESKKRFGTHIAVGVEKQVSKTTLISFEINKAWIEYNFRPLPLASPLDTNSLAVEASLLFKIGVED